MDAELEKLAALIKGSMDPLAAARAAVAAVEALAPPDMIVVPGAHEGTQEAHEGHAQGLIKEEAGAEQSGHQGEEDPAVKDEDVTPVVQEPEEQPAGGEAANGASSEPDPKPVAAQPEADAPKVEEQPEAKGAEEVEAEPGKQPGEVRAASSPEGAAAGAAAESAGQNGDASAKQEGHRPQKAWPVPEIKASNNAEDDMGAAEREVFPDLQDALKAFRKCTALVNVFKGNPATANKTPLAILHEYVNRISVELTYSEESESALGPFVVEAKVTSAGGRDTYALASGRGRSKREAKQLAAAAALEQLLASVPQSDFLVPGKNKQDKMQKKKQGGLQGPRQQQQQQQQQRPGNQRSNGPPQRMNQQGPMHKRPMLDGPKLQPPPPAKRQQPGPGYSPKVRTCSPPPLTPPPPPPPPDPMHQALQQKPGSQTPVLLQGRGGRGGRGGGGRGSWGQSGRGREGGYYDQQQYYRGGHGSYSGGGRDSMGGMGNSYAMGGMSMGANPGNGGFMGSGGMSGMNHGMGMAQGNMMGMNQMNNGVRMDGGMAMGGGGGG